MCSGELRGPYSEGRGRFKVQRQTIKRSSSSNISEKKPMLASPVLLTCAHGWPRGALTLGRGGVQMRACAPTTRERSAIRAMAQLAPRRSEKFPSRGARPADDPRALREREKKRGPVRWSPPPRRALLRPAGRRRRRQRCRSHGSARLRWLHRTGQAVRGQGGGCERAEHRGRRRARLAQALAGRRGAAPCERGWVRRALGRQVRYADGMVTARDHAHISRPRHQYACEPVPQRQARSCTPAAGV